MPLSSLNAEQQAASSAPLGHNLIIASAGTGKTSTIVGRIAHLMHQGITPQEILLLTFTNKAANEMISRLAALFGESKAKAVEAGTFHAVAYRYLKEKFAVSLKQPRELKTLFKSIYERRVFVQRSSQPPYTANYLYDLYSLYQNSTSEPFIEWMKKRQADQALYLDIYEDAWGEFSALKKEYGYVDYNDLLLLYREEMSKEESPFKEVLVDEYQDTNPLQYSILQAINPPSLFCVGDYDQSIYAFNGADISIIASFEKSFEDARIFTLTKNYRSTAPILALANSVIEKNERIYPKRLEVVKQKVAAPPPRLLVYDELFLQYQAIARRIRESTKPHAQIAVIFRNNSSADGIEASLRELGIPSKRKGGVSFFDSKEIALMLDIASLLHNPKDMMAFIHVLSYGKGIGSAIAKDIYEALTELGKGNAITGLLHPDLEVKEPYKRRAKNTQMGLFDDFFELGSVSRFKDLGFEERFLGNGILKHPKLTKEGAEFLYRFYQGIKAFRALSNPSALIVKIFSSELYQGIARNLAKERATQKDGSIHEERYKEALERIERKVRLLRDLSGHYESLGRFLNAMILGSGEMSEGEGVNLLSVHGAKGLEYEEVYIIDLMDGRFPNRKLMAQNGNIEEERRLFYVAVTRAKELLYLSYAKSDAIKNLTYAPSQFLLEAGLVKAE